VEIAPHGSDVQPSGVVLAQWAEAEGEEVQAEAMEVEDGEAAAATVDPALAVTTTHESNVQLPSEGDPDEWTAAPDGDFRLAGAEVPEPSPHASPHPPPAPSPEPEETGEPEAPPPPVGTSVMAVFVLLELQDELRKPARRRTYSAFNMPFIHALFQTGCYARQAEAWSEHGPAWAELVEDYRAFAAADPQLAPLLQHIPAASRGLEWPYLPAADEGAPANLVEESWPLRNRHGVLTQEGVLSQSPVLQHRLQRLCLAWQHAARPASPASDTAAEPADNDRPGTPSTAQPASTLPPAPLEVPAAALGRHFGTVSLSVQEAANQRTWLYADHESSRPRGRVAVDLLAEMSHPDQEMIEWVRLALVHLGPGEHTIRSVVDTIIEEEVDSEPLPSAMRARGTSATDKHAGYTSRVNALHRFGNVTYPVYVGPIKFNFRSQPRPAVVVGLVG